MNQICYLCGSKENSTVFNENGIPILECKSCGHIFSSYVQEEHYDGYWDENSDQDFDLDWWDVAHREIYSEFIQTFMKAEKGKILDVGCGLGFFIKTLQEKKPAWSSLGYEMSERAVKFGKEKNHLSNIYSGLVQNSGIEKNSLDIITLWDVIEHIPKPQPLLEYLFSILKPGGILFVQTPNVPIQLWKARLKVLLKGMKEGVHYLEAKDHINDYSTSTLNLLANKTGYSGTSYFIMKPILSVAGSKNPLGVLFKLLYYRISKIIWFFSFKQMNINNTLFAILKK